MKVSERLVVFVKDQKGKENKPFKSFSTTISSKKDDGSYINISFEVRFNTENIPQSALDKMVSSKCYVLEVEDGWLGAREYINKEGEPRRVPYIYVDKATVKESKPVAKPTSNDDLPF